MTNGGELLLVLLDGLKVKGRGDDICADIVVVDHEHNSKYGVLGIGNNAKDYTAAKRLALDSIVSGPICPAMIAVNKNDKPMMLTHEVAYKGKKHHLAALFNAEFAHNPEETSDGSFCLRLSPRLDPERKFSERIRYAPGKVIDWTGEQEAFLKSVLEA